MKRPVLLVALLLSSGVVVPGCPIYNEEGCTEDAHCAPGYVCEILTGECVEPAPQCTRPSDCSTGATCDRDGRCRSVDCSWEDVGCVSGYTCERDDGVWRCVSNSSSGGSGGISAGGKGGMPSSDGGNDNPGAGMPGFAGQPGSGGSPSGGAGGDASVSGGASPGGASSGGQSAGGASDAGGVPANSGAGGL